MKYEIVVFLDAETRENEDIVARYNLSPLEDATVEIDADTYREAREKARDYIVRELAKRGLRGEKSAESVLAYDGPTEKDFVCEFYGFCEP